MRIIKFNRFNKYIGQKAFKDEYYMDAYDARSLAGIDDVTRSIDDATLAGISAELAKTAAEHDRTGSFPHENIALLRRHGIIGLQAARDLAGDPLDLPQARRVIAAI